MQIVYFAFFQIPITEATMPTANQKLPEFINSLIFSPPYALGSGFCLSVNPNM